MMNRSRCRITAVCVRKPGPTEVVAIKNATLRIALDCQDVWLSFDAGAEVVCVVMPNLKFVVSLLLKNRNTTDRDQLNLCW